MVTRQGAGQARRIDVISKTNHIYIGQNKNEILPAVTVPPFYDKNVLILYKNKIKLRKNTFFKNCRQFI